ncbi:hypothetical protein ABEB36_011231 [Hypothenemus hampei]|uniref:Uncharacterized protein n=1 Tax=Hypothenemus hampei TaxID=57062 RepID=A0ABD1EF80_HYPHA
MAVPFNMPEDQTDVEVIIHQLQALLNKLKVAARAPPQMQATTSSSSSIPSGSRARHTSRERQPDVITQSLESISRNTLPDLLSNMSSLNCAPSGAAATISSPFSAISLRSPRQRTTSKFLNSDETKICITTVINRNYYTHEWIKIDNVENEESGATEVNGLFSKIISGSIQSCSLMTAMICFVGWHIFRAR